MSEISRRQERLGQLASKFGTSPEELLREEKSLATGVQEASSLADDFFLGGADTMGWTKSRHRNDQNDMKPVTNRLTKSEWINLKQTKVSLHSKDIFCIALNVQSIHSCSAVLPFVSVIGYRRSRESSKWLLRARFSTQKMPRSYRSGWG